jgi:hypothetical protein
MAGDCPLPRLDEGPLTRKLSLNLDVPAAIDDPKETLDEIFRATENLPSSRLSAPFLDASGPFLQIHKPLVVTDDLEPAWLVE